MGRGCGPATRLRLAIRDGSGRIVTANRRTGAALDFAMSATEKAGGRREGRQKYERMHQDFPFARSDIMVNAEWLRIGSRGLREVPDDRRIGSVGGPVARPGDATPVHPRRRLPLGDTQPDPSARPLPPRASHCRERAWARQPQLKGFWQFLSILTIFLIA
jgi:hypothetical protein